MSAPLRLFDETKPVDPSALPFEPFARMPHRAVSDRRLKDLDYRVLGALQTWIFRASPECWPSNAAIGAMIGKTDRSVGIALARLEKAGYLERIEDTTRPGTNRTIRLLFTTTPPVPPKISSGDPPKDSSEGGANDVGGPRSDLQTSPKDSSGKEEGSKKARKTIQGPSSDGPRNAGPPPAPKGVKQEPGWIEVEKDPTPEQLDQWERWALQPGPMSRIAARILDSHRPGWRGKKVAADASLAARSTATSEATLFATGHFTRENQLKSSHEIPTKHNAH